MRILQSDIDNYNSDSHREHDKKFSYSFDTVDRTEEIIAQLTRFQVAIPSWALGAGGTRFGRFSIGGEPANLEQKIDDVGLIHKLNQSSGAISLHIPWDIPTDAAHIKSLAQEHGLQFDAMNSNTFQDQQNQQHSYKYGSLQHVDKSVRKQAIAHNLDVIKHGIDLGSKSLTVWLSDGSCFPGQLNFRKAFQHVLESLEEIYHVLPPDWKLFIEYKAFEPNFYSMTVGDWGQSLLLANKLGPKAYTLVDLGHHLPNANIEQIVSLLLMENKLGGFHFNDSKYGDDDLTVGSIRPYQLFLIFRELVEGMNAQSVEAIQIAYAQALLVDDLALEEARSANDVVRAQEILQNAFRTDVRPIVAEARKRKGAALDPLGAYRKLKVREQLIKKRGANVKATGL